MALCKALDLNDYISNPSFATIQERRHKANEINGRIADIICTRERNYWLDLFRSHGIAANSETTLEEIPEHPQFAHRQLIDIVNNSSPATGVAFPVIVNNERWGKKRSLAPDLGQDTLEVLKSLGYSEGEIENLAKNGIICL